MSDGYSVIIRHMPTGEERAIAQEGVWDDAADFGWSEGNYSCDCNRALFFYDWGPESDNRGCGTDEFCIPEIVLSDGTRIEFEDCSGDHILGEEG